MLSLQKRQELLNEIEYLIETNGSHVRINALRRQLINDNKIRRLVESETKRIPRIK